jgi:hypothetical protein
MIHNNKGSETRNPNVLKKLKKFLKYGTVNTTCDVKK